MYQKFAHSSQNYAMTPATFISIDSETTGLDLYFSSRPFFVTSCTDRGKSRQWEWPVDPLTRKVCPDPSELDQIREVIASHDTVVCHNSKFDVGALRTIGIDVPWEKVEDTLVAAHVLDSSAGHRLDELAKEYLRDERDEPLVITSHEAKLEAAVKTGRRRISSAKLVTGRGNGDEVQKQLREWKIAVEGMQDLPSAKGGGADGEGKLWRNDYWLPASLAKSYPENPEFQGFATVLAEYAEIDSSVTVLLWPVLRDELVKRGLWKVYRARFAAVPAAYRMETRGVTINKTVLDAAQVEYTEEAEYLGALCVGIAKSMGYALTLPKSTTNHSIDDYVFGRAMHVNGKRDPNNRIHRHDTLNLEPLRKTDAGNPSFDYDARELYLADLKPGTKPYLFIESFGRRCELDTGLSYLAGYDRYVLPTDHPEFVVLHPNYHVTGAATTRWSHSNPNSANVSERSVVNARACFCPAPGREWYSMDAANIELRIPAYLAGERELIDVFERPNDPPYYGSYHLLVFDTLHTALFAKWGKAVKTECAGEYSCVKNGNFARQYGCQEAKADATYRVKGAYRKIGQRFPKIDALNRRVVSSARQTGGVTTLPDRSVDSTQGYPITCRRSSFGTISPTIPFAYFVSGTAGFWLNQAVVRCDEQLEQWRSDDQQYDGHMILSVHDELVFDLPILRTVDRVISGGQTGADQAGLRAGCKSGRATGGFINRGFKTLDGPNPSLADYGMVELDTDEYPVRTAKNVETADATIRFATDFSSAGEKCTANAIRRFSRPSLDVNPNSPPPLNEVVEWLDSNNVRTLNVAGNSERTSPGIGVFAEKFLAGVLAADNKNLPRVATLRKLMEQGGEDIGVPTPVTCERHTVSWAVGEAIK